MLRLPLLPLALVGLLVTFASVLRAAAAEVPYFSDNGYGNPVSSLQHPAGEHHAGVTYVAYQGPHEDPYVAAYVHATARWIGPVQAGVNPMGKSPDQIDPAELDNHGKPALVVDRVGHIHVVFGAHGGDPRHGPNPLGEFFMGTKGKMTHVVSERPLDISSWRVVDNLPPFGTYSQWVKLSNGDLYLFYRHGGHRSDWVFQKSVDDGRTFSAPVSVLRHKPSSANASVHDAWYAWFERGQGDTITASYVYHPCANPRHSSHRQNTYHMRFDAVAGRWTNVQGQPLTLPVTKESADAQTLIEATGSLSASHGTCRVDALGHPHVVFPVAREVRYYRWDGQNWLPPVAVGAGAGRVSDGDFIIETPEKVRMLLQVTTDSGTELGWWNTSDGGRTWARGAPLLVSSDRTFRLSALLANAHPDALLLASSRSAADAHLYRRMHLLGESGPLTRPVAEASHLGDRLERVKLLPAPSLDKAEAKRKKKAGLLDEEP
jgi:BNR repeat-containing family member